MRTEEQFSKTWEAVKRYHRMHNKPVWLVPREDDYIISVIKPEPNELPMGTASNLYDLDEKIIDTVTSSKKIIG